MSILFTTKDKSYDSGLTASVEEIIALDDHYVIFVFQTKEYQIWNVRNDKLLHSGKLKLDVRIYRILNEEDLLYLTITGELSILNLFRDFNPWNFQVKIPTFTTLQHHVNNPHATVDTSAFTQMVIASADIVVSKKHQLVCVSETINVHMTIAKQILTLFKYTVGASPISTVLVEEKVQMKAAYVHDKCLVLWNQLMFDYKYNKKSHFCLWDVPKCTQQKIEIHDSITDQDTIQCSTVVTFQPIEGTGRAVSFENTNFYPLLKIIDLETGKVVAQRILEQYNRASIICDAAFFCDVDPKLNRDYITLFLDIEGESSRIDAFNLSSVLRYVKKTGELSKNTSGMYAVAPKGNYIISVKDEETNRGRSLETTEFTFQLHQSFRSKIAALFCLKSTDFGKQVNMYVLRDIVSYIS